MRKSTWNTLKGSPPQGEKGESVDLLLYSLKQAPKQWNEKYDNSIFSSGFKINECNIYVKDTNEGYMLIVGSNSKIIKSTKKMLN